MFLFYMEQGSRLQKANQKPTLWATMANSIKDLLQVDWNPQTFHKNGGRVPLWSLILSVDGKKVVMDWLDRGTLQI